MAMKTEKKINLLLLLVFVLLSAVILLFVLSPKTEMVVLSPKTEMKTTETGGNAVTVEVDILERSVRGIEIPTDIPSRKGRVIFITDHADITQGYTVIELFADSPEDERLPDGVLSVNEQMGIPGQIKYMGFEAPEHWWDEFKKGSRWAEYIKDF